MSTILELGLIPQSILKNQVSFKSVHEIDC